jgi:hypothetical protein
MEWYRKSQKERAIVIPPIPSVKEKTGRKTPEAAVRYLAFKRTL